MGTGTSPHPCFTYRPVKPLPKRKLRNKKGRWEDDHRPRVRKMGADENRTHDFNIRGVRGQIKSGEICIWAGKIPYFKSPALPFALNEKSRIV